MTVPILTTKYGFEMPILGFGTWQAKEDDLERALNVALEVGYRLIDTAYVYRNEEVIGKVLNEWMASGRLKRSHLFVTTKLPNFGNRPTDVEKFLDLSLSKLGLDYVDLYLIHMPIGLNYVDDDTVIPTKPNGDADLDMSTDLVAIWKKLEVLVDNGKIRAIGVSNFNQQQIEKILKNCRIRPANCQIQLHAYLQEKELVKYLKSESISVTSYSTLGTAGTVNFLKAFAGVEKQLPNVLKNPIVIDIANELKKSPAQVLLRHMIQNEIAVIPKSIQKDRIRENFELFDFSLNKQQMDQLDGLDENLRILDMKDIFKGCENHPEYPW